MGVGKVWIPYNASEYRSCKAEHGIIERENYNKAKSESSKQQGCSEEKIKAIEDVMKQFQMILAGLRSLDSVSGSRYYSQLMEKIQTGSSEFISGKDFMLIDLSSWYKTSLVPKIEVIQSAIESRHLLQFKYYAPSGESDRMIEPYYLVFQ